MGADEKCMSIGSGLFTILGGLAAVGYFGWIAFQQSSAASWPTTQARIVTSRVELDGDITRANIVFEYSVDGQSHRSTELWFNSEPAGTQEDMQKLVAEYPLKRSIDVFYNPQDPSQAVVDPHKNAQLAKWTIGFGCVAVVVGASFLWSGLATKPAGHMAEDDCEMDFTETEKRPSRRQAETPAIRWVPETVSKAEAAKPQKSKGPRHWAVRAVAGVVGLPVLLIFGGVTIMILQQGLGENATHPLPVIVLSAAFSGGVTLFGLWLTIVCFSRRGNHTTCAAS
jgi:hypothetical protein